MSLINAENYFKDHINKIEKYIKELNDFLKKIPGPFLFFWSDLFKFCGPIVKSFEGANLWQILF